MENDAGMLSHLRQLRDSKLLKALGPGILVACAAVGGSHLVWSTRAGAQYGWSLVGLVLLANLSMGSGLDNLIQDLPSQSFHFVNQRRVFLPAFFHSPHRTGQRR